MTVCRSSYCEKTKKQVYNHIGKTLQLAEGYRETVCVYICCKFPYEQNIGLNYNIAERIMYFNLIVLVISGMKLKLILVDIH